MDGDIICDVTWCDVTCAAAVRTETLWLNNTERRRVFSRYINFLPYNKVEVSVIVMFGAVLHD